MLKIIAVFVHICLWLKVAISPVLIGAATSAIICIVRGEINIYIVTSFTGVGLIVGIFWAEKIRRTIGLSAFHGRLIGNPEIVGR